MRVIWAAFLFALLPGIAAAQESRSRSSEAPTLPTIGLPLPQIGLPLPSIGLSPGPTDTRSVAKDRQSPSSRNRHRGRGRSHARGTAIYLGPGYWWNGYSAPQGVAAPQAPEPVENAQPTPTGTLQLDVLPHDARMYVDGYYVGTPDDANGALTLDAGPHSIEMRAEGYEATSFDVMIEPGRTITYRGELSRTKVAPAAEPVPEKKPEPATRKPVYVIPGCYLGNVPPAEAGLPPTCDPSRAKVIQPS